MAKAPRVALNPRVMMERAIKVMRQSVPEYRPDRSPSPSVGAVLVRPDGSVATAARGELRDGNHAEFILLEEPDHVSAHLAQVDPLLPSVLRTLRGNG